MRDNQCEKSIDGQIREYKEFAEKNDIRIIVALKNIKIDFNAKNKEITICSFEFINNKIFRKWSCLSDWFNINVEYRKSTIKLNLKKSNWKIT